MLKVYPAKSLQTVSIAIPSSKPETQRAVFIGSLARGITTIHNDLRCLETETMKRACESLGSVIKEYASYLTIKPSRVKKNDTLYMIQSHGSGLVARTMAVRASCLKQPVIVTGDSVLRQRVMQPLFESLRKNGVLIEYLSDVGKLPIANIHFRKWFSEFRLESRAFSFQ